MRNFRNIIFCLVLFSFSACAVKKYIPEDKYLYRGAEIELESSEKLEDKSTLENEVESVLYPEPNSSFLGIYPGLHYHYVYKEKKSNFWRKFMYNKLGEKPVYYEESEIENTQEILRNRLENNGIFYSKINNEVNIDSSNKTAEVKYKIKVDKPYQIDTFIFEADSTDPEKINTEIQASLSETLIKKEERFNLKRFKSERERIDEYLKDKGYYYFNSDFLLFEADTNKSKERALNLYLKLKEEMPEKAKYPYVIDSVLVYPSVYNDTVYGVQDTTSIKGIDFIQNKENPFFKPKRLEPFILLEEGQSYSSESSKFSSRRLSNIGTYKFVNIQYSESDSLVDSLNNRHLTSTISLTPLPKRRIQFQLEMVTKSNEFTGPRIGATYTNRNIFKGGEDLRIEPNFGYEKQFSKRSKGDRTLNLGLKVSLLFPRMLFPANFDDTFKYAIPKTRISAGIDYMNRKNLYSLNSFSTSFGYIWDQNRFVNHDFNLINIDYVKLGNTSEQFEQALEENPFLRRSFEQQFIAGVIYRFTYSELNEPEKRGRLYFQGEMDIAGNGLSLFGKKQENGNKTFLGLKYAQYAKADIDVSYHFDLDPEGNQTLVGHMFGGLGLPYGNSDALPFVKQFFAGGPYSLRAFQIRGIGPGTYKPDPDSYSYFDQAGDIRLEANLEYRFPIFSIFKGAVFADAGNVWLYKENETLPGGKFSTDFIKELGIGTGVGVRVDVQGFVIRLDLSSPIKKPAEDWYFDYKNPVFNFGIGYPF